MKARLPLPALLSQTLVAFIIECDNQFEHRVPHRTTAFHSPSASRDSPWLVSMPMWWKLMRFIPPAGASLGEIYRASGLSRAELKLLLTRMAKWWRYLKLDAAGDVPAQRMVRPTTGGLKAIETWLPLTAEVEDRWRARFGSETIRQLRSSLDTLTSSLAVGLPEFLPILAFDLRHNTADARALPETCRDLPILLAKVLLAFALRFEQESDYSIAIASNLLRILTPQGVPARHLARLSGVAKPGVALMLARAQARELVEQVPDPAGGRYRQAVLTPKGLRMQNQARRLFQSVEKTWQTQFGPPVADLRTSLARLQPALFSGLQPYPGAWRAQTPKPLTLPHYPMLLHRGAFPDGA